MMTYEKIIEYVNLQKSIVVNFQRQFPQVKDYIKLLDCPKAGTLFIEDKVWIFQKHGAGMKFILNPNSLIVDIHKFFLNYRLVDVWRLEQYFQFDDDNREMNKFLRSLVYENRAIRAQQGMYEVLIDE